MRDKPTRALLPGSYDPITRGHLAVIEEAARRFDEVTVAVFINPKKQGLFGYAERIRLLCLATAHLPCVTVDFSEGMVADYAKAGGYTCIFKGIRNQEDRAYEEGMAAYNLEHSGGIPTVLYETPHELHGISSTAVRTALAEGRPIDALVPTAITAEITALFKKITPPPCGQ